MAEIHLDINLLQRCLRYETRAWADFVDRFMGLVLHVIDHTACNRDVRLQAIQRDTLCVQVFTALGHEHFRLLREFRAKSSLTTYLAVVVRRIVVRLLLNQSYVTTQSRFLG